LLFIFVIVVATIIAWFVMSRPFFLLMAAVFIGSFAFGVYATASANTTDREGLFVITLISANIGLYLLAIFLGILRKILDSEGDYKEKRNLIFKFLGKWGGLYTAFAFIARLILTPITGDSVTAWFAVKLYGVPVFAVLVMAFYIRRFKRKQRLSAPISDSEG